MKIGGGKIGLLKVNQALLEDIVDEARIVTRGTFDKNVGGFIKANEDLVKLEPGGIM